MDIHNLHIGVFCQDSLYMYQYFDLDWNIKSIHIDSEFFEHNM